MWLVVRCKSISLTIPQDTTRPLSLPSETSPNKFKVNEEPVPGTEENLLVWALDSGTLSLSRGPRRSNWPGVINSLWRCSFSMTHLSAPSLSESTCRSLWLALPPQRRRHSRETRHQVSSCQVNFWVLSSYSHSSSPTSSWQTSSRTVFMWRFIEGPLEDRLVSYLFTTRGQWSLSAGLSLNRMEATDTQIHCSETSHSPSSIVLSLISEVTSSLHTKRRNFPRQPLF